ncbi:MAG: hypothetical protein IPQ07_33555 [Myxococcales bacterium]|nr:hypothetical protein [Myxococcales bacterium]
MGQIRAIDEVDALGPLAEIYRRLADLVTYEPSRATPERIVAAVERLGHRAAILSVKGEGGHTGLPADFLILPGGVIQAVKYGVHADDQWSVDDLLAIVGEKAA